jgi:hypothetical protein
MGLALSMSVHSISGYYTRRRWLKDASACSSHHRFNLIIMLPCSNKLNLSKPVRHRWLREEIVGVHEGRLEQKYLVFLDLIINMRCLPILGG